jgi:hypothetical protein
MTGGHQEAVIMTLSVVGFVPPFSPDPAANNGPAAKQKTITAATAIPRDCL